VGGAVPRGAVLRIDPLQGVVTDRIRLPVARVTSCCFGGARLDELFITTARSGLPPDDLARQPHAGGIFRVRPGVAGFPAGVFKVYNLPSPFGRGVGGEGIVGRTARE
jgi:sugar lactone lactonase YvrE